MLPGGLAGCNGGAGRAESLLFSHSLITEHVLTEFRRRPAADDQTAVKLLGAPPFLTVTNSVDFSFKNESYVFSRPYDMADCNTNVCCIKQLQTLECTLLPD